jgi:hypothetical protein
MIWIKCREKDYHGSYEIACKVFSSGSRCSYCSHQKIHPVDSLGTLYPHVLNLWSNKNKKSPYEYASHSNKEVWWKCECGKHEDFVRKISVSNICEFRCPYCKLSKGEEVIERVLIYNNIYFVPQKTFDGLFGLGNGLLSYDFYLPNHNILIEYQGEQHEKYMPWFHKSEKDFEKQKEHDRRKRENSEKNNIKLLEIWYYDFDNIEFILEKELNFS